MRSSLKMLIIDDDPAIVFALHSYFSSLGWDVDTAQRLDQALQLLATGRYALVLTDLRLGGVRGKEGLEILSRALQVSTTTRVILLTAFGTPEIEDEARRLGVAAFLHKPLPLAEIAQVASGLIQEIDNLRAAIEEDHP